MWVFFCSTENACKRAKHNCTTNAHDSIAHLLFFSGANVLRRWTNATIWQTLELPPTLSQPLMKLLQQAILTSFVSHNLLDLNLGYLGRQSEGMHPDTPQFFNLPGCIQQHFMFKGFLQQFDNISSTGRCASTTFSIVWMWGTSTILSWTCTSTSRTSNTPKL